MSQISATLEESLVMEHIACPLCGCEQSAEVAVFQDWSYAISGTFRTVRCDRCRHVYLNPRPRIDALLSTYPSDYAPYQQSAARLSTHAEDGMSEDLPSGVGRSVNKVVEAQRSGVRAWKFVSWLRKVWHWWLNDRTTYIPAIETLSTRKVTDHFPKGLEVGCGAGAFSRHAAELGWNMHAIEPSASAAALAQESGINVFHGTLNEYRGSESSFDAIFAWMVLEHLPFPCETLTKFHHWLVQDGWLCLSVPNHRSLDRWLFGSKWIGYDGPRHLQQFEPRRLEKLLLEMGFSRVEIQYQPNLQYWFGSIAVLLYGRRLLDSEERSRIRDRFWMRQFHNGLSFPLRIVLSPIANLLSALGISGRITVLARKGTG